MHTHPPPRAETCRTAAPMHSGGPVDVPPPAPDILPPPSHQPPATPPAPPPDVIEPPLPGVSDPVHEPIRPIYATHGWRRCLRRH
jgi:hypothetical protein